MDPITWRDGRPPEAPPRSGPASRPGRQLSKGAAEKANELQRLDRLDEVLVEAGLDRVLAILELPVARERDEPDPRYFASARIRRATSKPSISGSPTSTIATSGIVASMSDEPRQPVVRRLALEARERRAARTASRGCRRCPRRRRPSRPWAGAARPSDAGPRAPASGARAERQAHDELGALALAVAPGDHGSAVHRHERAHQREPDAEAALARDRACAPTARTGRRPSRACSVGMPAPSSRTRMTACAVLALSVERARGRRAACTSPRC